MSLLLEKYDWMVCILMLGLVLAGVIGYLLYAWFEKTRQEEDELADDGADPQLQLQPQPNKCKLTAASLERFLYSMGLILVLVCIWFFAGLLWTLLFLLIIVMAIAWLTGHRFAVAGIAVMTILVLCAIGTWKGVAWAISSLHKNPETATTNTVDGDKPSTIGKFVDAILSDKDQAHVTDIGSSIGQGAAKTVAATTALGTMPLGDAGCSDEDGSETTVVVDGIEQPLVSPRPSKQPCNQKQVAPKAAARQEYVPPPQEFKPSSGDQGSLRIWFSGPCKFSLPDPNLALCHGHMQLSDPHSQTINLKSVSGKFGLDRPSVDFIAYANVVFGRAPLYFQGSPDTGNHPNTTLDMGDDGEFFFFFHVQPGTVTNVTTFTLTYEIDGYNFPCKATFMNIPVLLN